MDKIPLSATEQQVMDVPIIPEELQFETLKGKLTALEQEWSAEKNETERRRNIRKIEIDMETLRANGRLKADEVLIGVRVIDENIKKEQPIFVNYLTQSRRLAIFDCRSNPLLSGIEVLEQEFTKGLSYDGMLRNLFKVIDGAQTHGWDSAEVTYDESKPLHVGIEHIGHENLLFPTDAKDIQACEVIMRRFKLSVSQLNRFVDKHGFNPEAVNVAIEGEKSRANQVPKNVDIYKVFIKQKDVVYVAWCALDKNVDTWLKDPTPLSLGRFEQKQKTVLVDKVVASVDPITQQVIQQQVQVPEVQTVMEEQTESQYPIKIYLYSETEEQSITGQKGRVFFDLPWQEAQIALRSLFINGAMRASNVYGSPTNRSDVGGSPTKMDLTLEPGCFYSEPMNFWGPNYPDPTILRAADSLDVRKSAEMGQMASAVINRDDSRKTATELNKAESEQAKLASVSILLFSGFMRGLLGIAWYIVQNQAQHDKVLIAPFEIHTEQGSQVVNNPILINQVYDIKPAGDIDVVRRAERLEKRFQLLPIIQPFGGEMMFEFVRDLIREMLPQDAEKYINLMGQDQQLKQALMATAGMLKEAVTDEAGQLKPEFKEFAPQLQQLAQMGQQMSGGQQ
jgi:hypothetical protein